MDIERLIKNSADDLSSQYDIKGLAVEASNKLLEAGESSPLRLFISVRRLQDYLAQYSSQLEFEAVSEYRSFNEKTVQINGVKITEVIGGSILDYEQDIIFSDLKAKIDERKQMINLAYKMDEPFADQDGVVVPKVKIKSVRKNAFQVKY